MKRKNRRPVGYVTEGLGPRQNEITRWSFADPDHDGRQWVVIVHIHPKRPRELIYETGPALGGHWGHDSHGQTQSVESFLSTRSAPSWTCAPRKALLLIAIFLEKRQRMLEPELTLFLQSLMGPKVYRKGVVTHSSQARDQMKYPDWGLCEAPGSLSKLGKYGDEFEGLLIGRSHNDLRVLLLVKQEGAPARIVVASVNSDHVLAEFTTVSELQDYLANDGLSKAGTENEGDPS